MSSTTSEQRGFRPARTNDGAAFRTTLYPTQARNARAIFSGDPLYLINGRVQVWTTQASADAPPLIGIAGGVLDGNKRPFTHSLPSGGPFIPASTAGFVMVYDDPDTVFIAQANTSVGTSHTLQFATVSVGTPVTAAGKSGFELNVGSAVVSAAGEPFQILGLAPFELDGLGGTSNKVLCRISNHGLRRQSRLTPFAE